jgi:sulfur carrier protein
MKLTINGEKKNIGDIETLDALMIHLNVGRESKGVAVAVNGTVVPRGDWQTMRLNAGDEIEVIHAVQGG